MQDNQYDSCNKVIFKQLTTIEPFEESKLLRWVKTAIHFSIFLWKCHVFVYIEKDIQTEVQKYTSMLQGINGALQGRLALRLQFAKIHTTYIIAVLFYKNFFWKLIIGYFPLKTSIWHTLSPWISLHDS